MGVLAVLMTGCVFYEATGTIDEDGLVTGAVTIGYTAEAIRFGQQDGGDPVGELGRFTRANAAAVSNGQASVSPYRAGGFQGFKVSFSKVALTDFTKLMRHEGGSTGTIYRLTRGKDAFVFSAELIRKPGQITPPKEAFKDAEISMSLTFPGEVLASNGTVDGRTVTWRPELSTVTKLTATGRATSPEQPQPTSATTPGQTTPADESGGSTTIVIMIVVVLLLSAPLPPC